MSVDGLGIFLGAKKKKERKRGRAHSKSSGVNRD